MSNLMWKSEGSEDGNMEEQKMWKRKKWRLEKGGISKCGDWNMAKQELWRLKCGEVRAKRKKRKGRKDVFKEWNENGVKDWRGFRSGRRKLFEVEWNQLIAEDWREDVKI